MSANLLARSVRDGECLRWTGAHNSKGYGIVEQDGRLRGVHRISYETYVATIPDGLEIDHVKAVGCRFRDCIEPTHLEAVTHAENVRRTSKTHCLRGHDKQGKKNCRQCANAAQNAARSEGRWRGRGR